MLCDAAQARRASQDSVALWMAGAAESASGSPKEIAEDDTESDEVCALRVGVPDIV